MIVVILIILFVLIFFYYLINESQVDRIDIFLTVIVGWLGAIIGKFFGERAMENLDIDRKNYARKVNNIIDKYDSLLNQTITNLKKK